MTKLFIFVLLQGGISIQPYDEFKNMAYCMDASKQVQLEAQEISMRIETACVKEKDLPHFYAQIDEMVQERQANEALWGY